MVWVLSHPVVLTCSSYLVVNATENIKLVKRTMMDNISQFSASCSGKWQGGTLI